MGSICEKEEKPPVYKIRDEEPKKKKKQANNQREKDVWEADFKKYAAKVQQKKEAEDDHPGPHPDADHPFNSDEEAYIAQYQRKLEKDLHDGY